MRRRHTESTHKAHTRTARKWTKHPKHLILNKASFFSPSTTERHRKKNSGITNMLPTAKRMAAFTTPSRNDSIEHRRSRRRNILNHQSSLVVATELVVRPAAGRLDLIKQQNKGSFEALAEFLADGISLAGILKIVIANWLSRGKTVALRAHQSIGSSSSDRGIA